MRKLVFMIAQMLWVSMAFGSDVAMVAGEESSQSEVTIDDLVRICEGFDNPFEVLSDKCYSELDGYFLSRPVWEESVMYLYTGQYGAIHRSLVSLRSQYLDYDSTDYQDGKFPLWRDIFDDGIETRHDVVVKVFNDEACREIGTSGAINPELSKRCHSTELIKYAIYVDACLSGFYRDDAISKPGGRNKETAYERSLDGLHLGHQLLKMGGDVESFKRSALHSKWMAQKCQPLYFQPFDPNLQEYDWGSDGAIGVLDLAENMKLAYNAAVGIAARSGNDWAIRVYYPPSPSQDQEYWQSLVETDPVLVHRFLASPRGYSVLTKEEQTWQAVLAYELLRKNGAIDTFNFEEYIVRFNLDVSEEQMTAINEFLESPDVDRERFSDQIKLPW